MFHKVRQGIVPTEPTPQSVMYLYSDTDTPRTRVWGIDNQTEEKIEIAFGKLMGYDIPGYAVSTGVKTLIQNGAPGQSILRDPVLDTGGLPIAANYYEVSVSIAGQVLNVIEDAPDGYFHEAAVVVITYSNARISPNDKQELKLEIITGHQLELSDQ